MVENNRINKEVQEKFERLYNAFGAELETLKGFPKIRLNPKNSFCFSLLIDFNTRLPTEIIIIFQYALTFAELYLR